MGNVEKPDNIAAKMAFATIVIAWLLAILGFTLLGPLGTVIWLTMVFTASPMVLLFSICGELKARKSKGLGRIWYIAALVLCVLFIVPFFVAPLAKG